MGCATVGRFEIQQELFSAPLFSIYKVRDPKTGRMLVVYAIRLETIAGQQMAARFREHAKKASVLNSPNIGSIYGGGTDAGLFLISFEYVEGDTLRAILDNHQEFSPREVVDLARQVCCGLDHAHHRGMVHENLHPGNIIVELDGTAKIMDFGVPKEVGFRGSERPPERLHYLSPEQVKGSAPDARSNIFSWGAILYELVTGKKASPADTAEALREAIQGSTPSAPVQARSKIPAVISQAIMKALSKDPAARQQCGRELVAELESYRAAEKPAPRPQVAEPVMHATPMAAIAAPPPSTIPVQAAVPVAEPAGHVYEDAGSADNLQPIPSALAGVPSVYSPPEPAKPADPGVAIKARAAAAVRVATSKLSAKETDKRLSALLARAVPVGAVLAGVLLILGIISFIQARMAARPAPSVPAPPAALAPAPNTADPIPAPVAEEPATDESPTAEQEPQSIETPVAAVNRPEKRRTPRPTSIPASLSVGTGAVAISSVPEGAQVQIDGHGDPNWRTPFVATTLTAGPHTVTVSKPGYVARTETVQIEALKRATLAVSLTEVTANIIVSSDPAGAAVLVDGKDTGKFTPARLALPTGKHSVTVRKPGYFDYSSEAQLTPGEAFQVTAPLRLMGDAQNIQTAGGRFNKLMTRQPKDMASLQVRTRPKGARIMINNRMMDKDTPAEFFLGQGHYEIVLTMPGYKPLRKVVAVEGPSKTVIDEMMEK